MPLYEHVFITRHEISLAQVNDLITQFSDLIQTQGGTVIKTENWGLRNFSYKIKKKSKGYYVLLYLDAPSQAIQEMERQMKIHEDLLRFLTLRISKIPDHPSKMMQIAAQEKAYSLEKEDSDLTEKKPHDQKTF